MFELLLLIYLFPIVVIVILLFRLARWLVRNTFRLLWWFGRNFFVLLGKGLTRAFTLIMTGRIFNR